MRRAWLAIALLSASWLVGLGYYHHADWVLWGLFIAAGTALLIGVAPAIPRTSATVAGLVLLLPVIFMTTWPIGAAPVLMAIGLACAIAPLPRRWPGGIGAAAFAAGVVLAVQALAVHLYASLTGRSHELPIPLAELLGFLAHLAGIDAAADGNTLALHTMRKLHELGATWDLLLDPVSLAFCAGGIALLAMRASDLVPGRRLGPLLRACGALLGAMALWLPVRATLMMAILIHRSLRLEFDAPLILMDQLRSTWVLASMMIVPVLLAARWVVLRTPPTPDAEAGVTPRSAMAPRGAQWVAIATALAAAFAITFGALWEPAGVRKPGRVLVDEHHSIWEPTQRPFDTEWYGHESGYNYYCIYDYLSRFYDMGRIDGNTSITDDTLKDCDVLVVKVPTSRYEPSEIRAIEKFVRDGGGLALIGEHTDVFGTGVSLNDIGKRFGATFRYDVILDTDTVFEQKMARPLVPHPTLQYFDDFDFAVTASIEPATPVAGRSVVLSSSLRSLGPDYHASNFYPQVDDEVSERYGTFVQAWSTHAGQGRVFAWADSTVWSNFCTFEPGKAELMLGIVEWLDHRDGSVNPRWTWLAVAVLFAAIAIFMASRWRGGWVPLIAALFLGWCLGVPAVRAAHARAMPPPAQLRPLHRVIMDRTVCAGPLSRGGFIEGKNDGFGVFERWILRLGYFLKRAAGPDALHDDLIVFTYPIKDVPAAFRDQLVKYVETGGKILVIDAAENEHSAANSLLYPFGLQFNRQTPIVDPGDLVVRAGWPIARVAGALEVHGGDPLFRLGDKPVAATIHFGRGSVTALGIGSRLTDPNMGVTGDTMPDDDLLKAYHLDYALMRWLVEGTTPSAPATQPTTAPADAIAAPASQPTTAPATVPAAAPTSP